MGPLPKGAGACSDVVKSMDSIYGLAPMKATKMGLELKRMHPIPLGRETRPEPLAHGGHITLRRSRSRGQRLPRGLSHFLSVYWWLLVHVPHPTQLVNEILYEDGWSISDFTDTSREAILCDRHTLFRLSLPLPSICG